MVNWNKVQEDETEYESSDQLDYTDLLEYSKDELAQTLIKCIWCEQDYLSKTKILKKTIRDLTFKKGGLEKSNNAFTQRSKLLK